MVCSVTCSKCGLKFDKWSGKLLNLSDDLLKDYYTTSFVSEWLKSHRHVTLCSDCLKLVLQRNLRFSDIKFKNNRWMTSNVVYLICNSNLSDEIKQERIAQVRELDLKGVLPFKNDREGWNSVKLLLQ